MYEIKCLSCEKKIIEEIEAATEDEEKRKELKEKAKIPTYIGESSRSAYERGFEHLEKLTSLNSKSQMLRHVVDKHEKENVENVQWGMTVLKYMKSAFERQIEEAVTIERKAKEGEILNSKCEYNQTTLPRLITRIGDREAEMKEWEKEIRKEKEYEERMEEKIRILRKDRNKERLRTEKSTQPRKKRKTEDSYISIRSVWGPPPSKAPIKNVAEDIEKEKFSKKRRVETEIITNVKRIDDKIYEGETIVDFEIEEKRDWDKVVKEHTERLEKEAKEREEKIKHNEIKEKSWQLYKECKKFLEDNEKNWEKLKVEREKEEQRKHRLHIARKQQEESRKRIKEKKLKEDIAENLKKLPEVKRNEILQEEKRLRNLEIAETKKNLWKLRRKENLYEKKNK